ncbi:MAG: FAD-dependent oxidoreductase [Eubacteriales bacterium]|nr:FAD-dependent oxidoreductase [Eubacteriales bacterium]
MYDIIIIGGGPAGVSAAVYARSRGKKVLMLERNRIGGMIGTVSTVTHYTALTANETGDSFAGRMSDQLTATGTEIRYEAVTNVHLTGDVKKVETATATYEAERLIIAAGTTPRKLGIPGEAMLAGKGMGMNAARDGVRYKGKNVYVIGGADGAVKEAIYLSQFAATVHIVCVEDELACIAEFREKVAVTENITVIPHTRLLNVQGADAVEVLTFIDVETDGIRTVADSGCGIFVYAGATPNTKMFSDLILENGYIPVNARQETAIHGVYAAGDITVKQVRQVATAVADGAVAGIHASS